jgi:hypothetical protein
MLQDSWDLSLRSCYSQAPWVRCTFLTPSFLGLEGDVKPKLIIIIIIIIIITDFTLKIKSIFFLIVIIFIVNLIIFIILIIIFNLFVQVLIFFNLF